MGNDMKQQRKVTDPSSGSERSASRMAFVTAAMHAWKLIEECVVPRLFAAQLAMGKPVYIDTWHAIGLAMRSHCTLQGARDLRAPV